MFETKKIIDVKGRQILDSRGNPTVEVELRAEGGFTGRAAVPSGASTGQFEALELRDGDPGKYGGKSVEKAVHYVNTVVNDGLKGMNCLNQMDVDVQLLELDGTEDKSKLGANTILGASLACAKAAAGSVGLPLYQYVGGIYTPRLPIPMMNILNGGAHAANNLDVQEFMIVPIGGMGTGDESVYMKNSLREPIQWCCDVYRELKSLLKEKHLNTGVGDEGGFAPDLRDEEEAIELILTAIEKAGYSAKTDGDFMIALDVAASEWKEEGKKTYRLPKKGTKYDTGKLIENWKQMIEKYPILSLEDPLDEEDWDGWNRLTKEIGDQVMLVGDDLFVTNCSRLEKGIRLQCGNAILIKPNQIGTLTETVKAVEMARGQGYQAIMSHRSGETEDVTIADLAVGLGTRFIKTGAPCRGERTAKYNQLLRIEEQLY